MKLFTFLRFFREVTGKKPVNIEKNSIDGLACCEIGANFRSSP